MANSPKIPRYPHRHLLGIEGLTVGEISYILDRSNEYVGQNRRADKKVDILHGRTIINLFFVNGILLIIASWPDIGLL